MMKCSSLTPFRVCLCALLALFLLSCLDGEKRAAWLKEKCPVLERVADYWGRYARFSGAVLLNEWEKKIIDRLAYSPVFGLSVIGEELSSEATEFSSDKEETGDGEGAEPGEEAPVNAGNLEVSGDGATGNIPVEDVVEGEIEAAIEEELSIPVYVPDLTEICRPFMEVVCRWSQMRMKGVVRENFVWTGHVSLLLKSHGWNREGMMRGKENLVKIGSSLARGLLSEVKTSLFGNTAGKERGTHMENSVRCLESVYEELRTRMPDEKKTSMEDTLTAAEKALLYSEAVFDEFRTRSPRDKIKQTLGDRMRSVARNRKSVAEVRSNAGMVLLAPSLSKPIVPKAAVARRFLLIGDSMMEDFGPVLQRALHRRKELKFVQAGKHSTGLVRPDYYDWPQNLTDYLKKHKPDIVVFFMGANDPQPIREDRKFYNTCSSEWKDAYGRRVKEMLNISTEHGVRALWVGLPIMGVKPLAEHVKVINQVQKKVCMESGVPFVDTEPTLADAAGQFQSFVKDERNRLVRLRTKDKQHMTNAGNKMLVEQFLPVMEKYLEDWQNTVTEPARKTSPASTEKSS